MIKISHRYSDAIRSLYVDAIKGTALVQFQSGHTYTWQNVSRRAILNLQLNPSISLGFWVIRNLTNNKRAKLKGSTTYAERLLFNEEKFIAA